MNLNKLIELIAEVAVKRSAQEREPKDKTPDAVTVILHGIAATLWRNTTFGCFFACGRPRGLAILGHNRRTS